MKLFTSLLFGTLALSTLHAQTTMCFKENHQSMSTIENTPLDGGECKSKFSLNDMKNTGWSIKDIKVTPKDSKFSFIYILSKKTANTRNFTNTIENNNNNNVNVKDLKQAVLKELRQEEEIKKAKKEKKKLKDSILEGKNVYVKKCQNCHGAKGEQRYGSAGLINRLNLDEFKSIMRDYGNMSSTRGQSLIMYQYSQAVTNNDIENIHKYLKSINN